MTISGGVKFFEPNMALAKNGVTIVSSVSNDAASGLIIDDSKITRWESIGSNNSITEILTITFPSSVTINRMFLLKHNFKNFIIYYWTGSSFSELLNVIDIDGVKIKSTYTDFTHENLYLEFDEVSTTIIKIEVDFTQTPGAQKHIASWIATSEIGTFTGYPGIKPIVSRNESVVNNLSRKKKIFKSFETFAVNLNFGTYPETSDLTLADLLFDREDPFLVYLSGGRTGSSYFKTVIRGFRLEDLYLMQSLGIYAPSYTKNIYTSGVNVNLSLTETI